MRTIVGSVIGALAMGVLLIAYNGAGRAANGQAQIAASPYATPARFVSDGDRTAGTGLAADAASATAGSVLVTCEPNQQAVARETRGANNEIVRQISCVGTAASSAVYVDQFGRTVAVPGSRTFDSDVVTARPVRTVIDDQPRVVRERVVYQRAPERVVRRSGRSWQKSALVIGGSAGTGAGVGAIAGGKKGALIGAAIGGGAASLYEAIKR
jgi:hypothetical protein